MPDEVTSLPQTNWSREEVEAVISDYLEMLQLEISRIEYNKAEHNRALQKLTGRNKGSIEFKHQNISAVMIELGFPYINGYKPRGNYQDLLRVCLEERLIQVPRLIQVVEQEVVKPVDVLPKVDFDHLQVDAPKQELEAPGRLYEKPQTARKVIGKNYLEQEARNQALGVAGEKLIVEFEHLRLWKKGKRKLADRVEHVAQTKGDGLGYDILSFEENGCERFIEVKTTRYGAMTPFFATCNEVNVSESASEKYHLFRLYNFSTEPRFYGLVGSLLKTCRLEPVSYAAHPR